MEIDDQSDSGTQTNGSGHGPPRTFLVRSSQPTPLSGRTIEEKRPFSTISAPAEDTDVSVKVAGAKRVIGSAEARSWQAS